MVGSNKILTVSYGTFSCTLEGFDDSFHSMKAIAEYFRDLAQDDRYFGAEPPTPDAEMLARIAEREISRRVEADIDERGIRLRASAPQVENATPATMEDADAEPEPAPTVAVTMPPAAEAPADAVQPTSSFMNTTPDGSSTPAAAPADPGSVAAKLQRIRAVVGTGTAVAPVVDVEDFEDAPEAPFKAPAPEFEDEADVASALPDDLEDASVAENDTIPQEDEANDTAFEEGDHTDTVAAETADEKDNTDVLGSDVEDTLDADVAEDIVADDQPTDVTDDSEPLIADADTVAHVYEDDALAEDAVAENLPDAVSSEADSGEINDDGTADEDTAAVAEEIDPSEDIADSTEDESAENVGALDAAWAEAALQAESAQTAADEDVLTDDITPDDVLTDSADDSEDDLSSDLNDIDPPETAVDADTIRKARIVRIRKDGPAEVMVVEDDNADPTTSISARLKTRLIEVDAPADEAPKLDADTETTPAPYEADTSDHNNILAAVAAAMPVGSLSDEDEDDLQRELAAVAEEVVSVDEVEDGAEVMIEESADDITGSVFEDAVDPETSPADVADENHDALEVAETEEVTVAEDAPVLPAVTQSEPKGRKRLPDADYAVTRMIAQTDEALNEPAGSRRRNAIAQLKAAVAATEAARQLGDKSGAGDDAENAFRDDLDQVVRPSRPIETDGFDTDRPQSSPLKLVASQRVDSSESGAAPADASEAGGFAQFAASMGAKDLPDLLEAAAAYTSFVEGIEDFSRPQIMKKVQMTTTEEFSREDGLRSFGTLLRQGRISKVRNGRFQVSEQTRFRPDARSA